MTTTRMQSATGQIVWARAKAFSSKGIREYQFLVDSDGTVAVWDNVAGHYTTCHSLGESAILRIRKLAEILK